jgi:hypothetical protein
MLFGRGYSGACVVGELVYRAGGPYSCAPSSSEVMVALVTVLVALEMDIDAMVVDNCCSS